MPIFLASFCAPEGPLTKAVGIFLKKQPPPWGPTIPLGNFKKLSLQKSSAWGCEHFWRAFCAPGGPLAKTIGILLKKLPPPWGPTIPLGNFKMLPL